MRTTVIDPAGRLDGIPVETRSLFFRVELLRDRIEELKKPLIVAATYQSPDIKNPQNSLNTLENIALSKDGVELAGREFMLKLLENSPEFAEASAVMTPALALIDSDLAQLERANELEGDAIRAEEAAREAAEGRHAAKLAAEIAKDPKVIAARAALAGVKRLGQPLDELASDAEELRQDFK